MDRVDILFYASITLTGVGILIMLFKGLFMFGGLMVGTGMFSMLLILTGKIFVTIVDGLGRGFC